MTYQPTQLLSRIGSGPVGVCVIDLQLDFLLHSSLDPDCLVGFEPPCNSTVKLAWVIVMDFNQTYRFLPKVDYLLM